MYKSFFFARLHYPIKVCCISISPETLKIYFNLQKPHFITGKKSLSLESVDDGTTNTTNGSIPLIDYFIVKVIS